VYVAESTDGGSTFSAPRKVNTDIGTHYMPWIAAGSSGAIDVVYYRTSEIEGTGKRIRRLPPVPAARPDPGPTRPQARVGGVQLLEHLQMRHRLRPQAGRLPSVPPELDPRSRCAGSPGRAQGPDCRKPAARKPAARKPGLRNRRGDPISINFPEAAMRTYRTLVSTLPILLAVALGATACRSSSSSSANNSASRAAGSGSCRSARPWARTRPRTTAIASAPAASGSTPTPTS